MTAETTEPHTRLLRLGLAPAESKEYWLHASRQLAPEDRVRVAFEERWFGSRSMVRVRYLMTNLAYRFDAFPDALQTLHRWSPDTDCRIVCHWHLQLTDPLYREFTHEHLAQRREHPEPTVDRNAVLRWLDQKTGGRWAASTAQRMAASFMTVLNEAGYTRGVAALRPLSLPRVSDQALAYLLYLLRETRFEGSLGQNPYLASVGLAGPELERRLDRLPGVRFRKQADVSDLSWDYPNLLGWANGLSPSLATAFDALRRDLLHAGGPRISTMRNYSFAILVYPPDQEFDMRLKVRQLSDELRGEQWAVLEISLQRILLNRLRTLEEGVLDRWVETEKRQSKRDPERALNRVKESLANLLEGDDGLARDVVTLIEEFTAKYPESLGKTLIWIKRMGALYPFYRCSSLLKHLDGKTQNVPVVLLYPGERIDKTSLSFMGEMPADRDYRPRIY